MQRRQDPDDPVPEEVEPVQKSQTVCVGPGCVQDPPKTKSPPAGETPAEASPKPLTTNLNLPNTPWSEPTAISEPTNTLTAPDSDTALNATSSPSSGNNNNGGGSGVSPGAVAGIAIGTAIAGAAIAFLIAFILFKKRRGREAGTPMGIAKYESNPELVSLSPTKGQASYAQLSTAPPPVAATTIDNRKDLDLANLSNSSDFLAGVLPRSADAATIRTRVSKLFDQVSQHVNSYYRDVHASITPSMEEDLSRFGRSRVGMVELLQGSSNPTVAIKHALMGYVLAITSPEAEKQETLFPKEIAGIASGSEKNQLVESSDLAASYILHRRLSTFLHNSIAQSTSHNSAISSSIREAAEHFALTFFPWANPGYGDQEKDEDLVQIIQNALEIMMWLYGQPFIYEFMWEGVGSRGIIVSPGLVKLSDAKGKVIKAGERGEIIIESRVVGT